MAIEPDVLLKVNYFGMFIIISAIILVTIIKTIKNNVDPIFLYISLVFCIKLYIINYNII